MAVINTGLVVAGIKSEFFSRLSAVPTFWQDLSTRLPSNTEVEKYAFLGSVPQMREWVDERRAKGLNSETYSVANKKYEITLEIDEDEIADDQTGQIRIRVGEMAEQAATHKDFLIEELLKNGESAGFLAYDGQIFFSQTHVSHGSGTQSNLLTYDVGTPDAPTLAERRAGLAQAISSLIAYKDDQGQPKRSQPTGLVVVCHPSQLFGWLDAVGLPLAAGTINPLAVNALQNAARVIAMPGLTDASKWYLLKVDTQVRPFIFQDREPISFQSLENGEEQFNTGKFKVGVRGRYAMTYGYWQFAVATDFV